MRVVRAACTLFVLYAQSFAAGLISSAQPPAPVAASTAAKLADLPATILGPGEYPIELGTALRLAGVENPELLLARQRVVEFTALRQLAAAQILPSLNAGTSFNNHTGRLQQADGNILKVNRDALDVGLGTYAVGAGTVNIPGIYYNLNVGSAWFSALRARQLVVRAQADSTATQLDVLLRTCLAYSELLRAEGRRAVALRNRAEVAQVAVLTASYAQIGEGPQADADRAEVELKRRDLDFTQAEADMLTASARLCGILNLDPATRLRAIDGWVVPAPIVPEPTPLPDLIAMALLNRPEMASRRAEIREALYGLSSAKLLPFSPNVILGFSAGAFGGGSNLVAAGLTATGGNTAAGPRFGNFSDRTDLDVVAYWTLQNLGVGNVALIRGARSRVRQAEFRELETLNRIRTEVAQAHARMRSTYAQLETLEKAVLVSERAFREDYTRVRGRQGLPIEALDSARLLTRARNDYLDAIIGYNEAQFQLYVAIGRPPAAMMARPIPASLMPKQDRLEVLPAPKLKDAKANAGQ